MNMLAQVNFPKIVLSGELDDYLTNGWFRMGQSIFTTNFLNFNQQFYSSIWLRIGLSGFLPDKLQGRLFKQNQGFKVTFGKATITSEKEQLFQRYRSTVSFEASPSLQHLLFGKGTTNVFHTWEVCVFDGEKLIGCGFFDLGHSSAAGISSFYDPDYKKYSLGKFLIYLKIQHCSSLGLTYFYPGYFVPGYKPFDYKLQIHQERLEFFQLRTKKWRPVSEFNSSQIPLSVMHAKLVELQAALTTVGVQSAVLYYEFYDASLVPELSTVELFDYPVFLHFYDLTEDRINSLIVYDVQDQQYHLKSMVSLWSSKLFTQEGHYSSHLLQTDHEVIVTDKVDAIALILSENYSGKKTRISNE
jgi:leucyl-tRNA---protein transferase